MNINFDGVDREITEGHAELVRQHVRVIDGEHYLSAEIVQMMLRTESMNLVRESDYPGVVNMYKLSRAFEGLVDIYRQV